MKKKVKKTKLFEKTEAELINMHGNMDNILGVMVSSSPRNKVLGKVIQKCKEKDYTKTLFIVTAYSEFFLEAEVDKQFAAALDKADMVLPDGVSVPAAADYLTLSHGSIVGRVVSGLRVGVNILGGKYANRVMTGVRLMDDLLKQGNKYKWKIFLLGGYGNTADRLVEKLQRQYPGLRLGWDRAGKDLEEIRNRDKEILAKVNRFKPDILFVAMGRYKQEKWIARQLGSLSAKVVVGVGSSFDELLGEGLWAVRAPKWIERSGLKWLWRVSRDPKHIKRAWRAFPVFAWKVFRSS